VAAGIQPTAGRFQRIEPPRQFFRMGLFSFFKRPAAKAPASGDAAQAVDAARTTARRRLIGAVLLLGIGVIAFPLLFETQPRPLPVDISIEIPKKEGAAPLAIPAPRPAAPAPFAPTASAAAAAPAAAPIITESKADAGKEVPAAPEVAAKAAAKPEAPPKVASKASPPSKPVPAAETKPAGETPGRFVVQVGAFADVAGAREARAKVEKLGLKTYTQAVDTDKGKRTRVRLGPFASRDDAEKAAAKVKAAGLPAAVLTL
jgi:DedD protein